MSLHTNQKTAAPASTDLKVLPTFIKGSLKSGGIGTEITWSTQLQEIECSSLLLDNTFPMRQTKLLQVVAKGLLYSLTTIMKSLVFRRACYIY